MQHVHDLNDISGEAVDNAASVATGDMAAESGALDAAAHLGEIRHQSGKRTDFAGSGVDPRQGLRAWRDQRRSATPGEEGCDFGGLSGLEGRGVEPGEVRALSVVGGFGAFVCGEEVPQACHDPQRRGGLRRPR